MLRRELKGPNGIVILGPPDSWKSPLTKRQHEMHVRIKKTGETNPGKHYYTPDLFLRVGENGLLLRQSGGGINPYRNEFTEPKGICEETKDGFLIETKHFQPNASYVLSIETNVWGDFVILKETGGEYVMVLNFWAIFGEAAGLEVRSDGSFRYGGKIIGKIPNGDQFIGTMWKFDYSIELMPFFVSHRSYEMREFLNSFQKVSHEMTFELIRKKTSSPPFRNVKGVREAKRIFKETFPQ